MEVSGLEEREKWRREKESETDKTVKMVVMGRRKRCRRLWKSKS